MIIRVGVDNRPGVSALVELLGGLPLALRSAGAYMNAVGISASHYLSIYDHQSKNLKDFMDRMPELSEYDNGSLMTTWEISLSRVKQINARAPELLTLCSYMDNGDLWYELFQNGVTEKRLERMEEDGDPPFPDWLIEIGQNELLFYETIKPLVQYSFMRKAKERRSYSIHPLVHRWASLRIQSDAKRASVLASAFSLIGNNVPNYNVPESSALMVRLSPHIRCARLSRHFGNISCARAAYNVGLQYRNQGRFLDAKDMGVRSQKIRLQKLGPGHLLTLKSDSFLANIDRKLGFLDQSKVGFERAIVLCKQHLGKHHEHTSRTFYDAALVHVEFGNFSRAFELYSDVIAARKEMYGKEHLKVQQAIGSEGNAHMNLHQLEKAEECYTIALAGKLKLVGMEHRTTMFTLDNLGILHAHQGKFEESERELKTVLFFRTENLGHLHTSTLRTYQHLGELYTMMGNYVQADELLMRALEGHEKVLGRDHQEYRVACTAYGRLREAQHRWPDADKLYSEVLSQRLRVFGPKNYYTREAREDLDRVRKMQGLPSIDTDFSRLTPSKPLTPNSPQHSWLPPTTPPRESPNALESPRPLANGKLWTPNGGGRSRSNSTSSVNTPMITRRPSLWSPNGDEEPATFRLPITNKSGQDG